MVNSGGSPRRRVVPLVSGCSPRYAVALLTDSFISFILQCCRACPTHSFLSFVNKSKYVSRLYAGYLTVNFSQWRVLLAPNVVGLTYFLFLFLAWAGKALTMTPAMCHALQKKINKQIHGQWPIGVAAQSPLRSVSISATFCYQKKKISIFYYPKDRTSISRRRFEERLEQAEEITTFRFEHRSKPPTNHINFNLAIHLHTGS